MHLCIAISIIVPLSTLAEYDMCYHLHTVACRVYRLPPTLPLLDVETHTRPMGKHMDSKEKGQLNLVMLTCNRPKGHEIRMRSIDLKCPPGSES